MKDPVLHKGNYKKTVSVYVGLGKYQMLATPFCGRVKPYTGRNWFVVRNWAQVTCKHCLNKRPKVDIPIALNN